MSKTVSLASSIERKSKKQLGEYAGKVLPIVNVAFYFRCLPFRAFPGFAVGGRKNRKNRRKIEQIMP